MLVAAQRAKVAGLVLFASMVCGLGGGPPADQGQGDGDGVSEVLDQLHRYASERTASTALFAEDAVFAGTDATGGGRQGSGVRGAVARRGWTYTLVQEPERDARPGRKAARTWRGSMSGWCKKYRECRGQGSGEGGQAADRGITT